MTVPPKNDTAPDVVTPARRRARSRPRRHGLALVMSVAIVLTAAGAAWLVLRPPFPAPARPPVPIQQPPAQALPAPAPAPVQRVPAPRAVQPQSAQTPAEHARPFDITAADEATILAARPSTVEVFRFQDAPRVLVLSFPSLHEQGRMFDRIGAFEEKTGLPRDRVLDETDLQAAIRLAGDTEDTYYYGHDYRAADMARFFALADRDGIVLHPEEELLRRLLTQEGMLVPGATGAVISIPPNSATPPIDEAARATILHHELSHGAYFTDPAYAAYARNFWETVLTEAQRANFRRFLGSEGYDETNEDLMLNEAQAYLIHTRDRRYFRPELVGLSEAEAARLRRIFLTDMPATWLNDPVPVHSP
jgi:hypothetical protein